MNSMVKTVYIIHQNGIPLLTIQLDDSSRAAGWSLEELFGGFSSAINTLIRQLGHKELKSIVVSDGLLVYSFKEPVIFVVFTSSPQHEHFAKILVKQIEYEFFKEYEEYLKLETSYIRGERYLSFKSTVRLLLSQMEKINKEYPRLLEFLPSFIPLHYIYMVLNLGLDISKRYPEETIKLVRNLHLYFEGNKEMEKLVARTIGRYSGHLIAETHLKKKVVIDEKGVLKLLNEISVCKYDKKHDTFVMAICPICRGKKAETPICDFFSGFIEGAIGNPSIQVEEISCIARGDKSCSFKLLKK